MAEVRHTLTAEANELLRTLDQVNGRLQDTSDAEAKANEEAERFKRSTAALGVALTAVAAASAAAVKKAIDYGDSLSKMSQRTGVAVESLSKLKLAADLSDTSLEGLATGLKALTRGMVDAAQGGVGPTAEALSVLGIEAVDASGKIRSTEDVLGDVAEAFAHMEDGATKTALAQDLFGKSGLDLIPVLNGGREALEASAKASEELGLVWSEQDAAAAADLNDAVTELKAVFDGFIMEAARTYLPTLQDIARGALLAAKALAGVTGAQDEAATAARDSAREAIEAQADRVEAARAELEAAQAFDELLATAQGQAVQTEQTRALTEEYERQREVLRKLKAESGADAGLSSGPVEDLAALVEARFAAGRAADAQAAADKAAAEAAAERAKIEKEAAQEMAQAEREAAREAERTAKERAKAEADAQAEIERLRRDEADRFAVYQAELADRAREAAEERIRIEQTVGQTILGVIDTVATGTIDSLRQLNRARTTDLRQRREREIGLAVLLGEIKAGLAFATTLAEIGGTPVGYAAAAAAATAVGVATKVSAAAGSAAFDEHASTYHDGGLVDEVDIRAKIGEVVLPAPVVRQMGGPDGVERMVQDGGAREMIVVQKMNGRIIDVQVHDALRRTGSPLESAVRGTNPRGTARRNPYGRAA